MTLPSAGVSARRVLAYRRYALGLCILVAGSLLVWPPRLLFDLGQPGLEFWVLICLAVITDLPPFTVRRPGPLGELSLSVLFAFAISIEYGGGTGRITQIAAILVASVLTRRRSAWLVAFDAGRYGVAILAASIVLELSYRPLIRESDPVGEVVVVLAAATWLLVFRALSVTGRWLLEDGGWFATFRDSLVRAMLPAAVALTLAPLIVAVITVDGWLLPVALLPAYALSRLGQAWYGDWLRDRQDALTGLRNRVGLKHTIEERIRTATTTSQFAVVLIGLDRFRDVNEALGHDVGDEVLRAVAERLRGSIRGGAVVGRLGGDEFAIVTATAPSPAAVASFVHPITGVLADPIQVDNLPITIGATTGVAVYPSHGDDAPTLLRHADAALSDAKASNARIRWYRRDLELTGRERLRLLADLRQAILDADPGLTIHYQPQVRIDSGEIVGVEALLRWRHPRLGQVSPDDILRVAEQSHVMGLLTGRILDDLLRQVAAWRESGLTTRVSVNLSAVDVARSELVDWLSDRAERYGVPGSALQVEITETALTTELDRLRASLLRLRERGINVALDDFGTGFSSLEHLRTMPVNEVKLDRAYVAAMPADRRTEAIVRSIARLGRDLGLRVVVEGLEDQHTRDLLAVEPGVIAQGWLYAPAMAADEVAALLRRGRVAPGGGPSVQPAG